MCPKQGTKAKEGERPASSMGGVSFLIEWPVK